MFSIILLNRYIIKIFFLKNVLKYNVNSNELILLDLENCQLYFKSSHRCDHTRGLQTNQMNVSNQLTLAFSRFDDSLLLYG